MIIININGYGLNDIVAFDYQGSKGEGVIIEVIYDEDMPRSYHYKIQATTSSNWDVFESKTRVKTTFIADFTDLELISKYVPMKLG